MYRIIKLVNAFSVQEEYHYFSSWDEACNYMDLNGPDNSWIVKYVGESDESP